MGEANAMLLVMQTPQAGREDEHRDWYVTTHLPDICAVPGVMRGEYTKCVAGSDAPAWTNAAVYWLDGEPGSVLDEIFRRVGAGQMKLSDTLDPDRTLMTISTAITPRMRAKATEDTSPDKRQLYIVLTNPTADGEQAYNDWYSGTHLGDVLDVPGFTAAQRFKLLDHPALKPSPYRYLALYEMAADAAGDALAELSARAGTDRMVLSPALDTSAVHAVAFAPEGMCEGSA